jgi:hypothetical protein
VTLLLAGDDNVVATDQEIYPTRPRAGDTPLQPESRLRLRRLLDPDRTELRHSFFR